ncbi:5'/3'-nucleotidase SurE [Desulfovibrio inopinatus]|uniref:5'/3'-nucleotidase SurE n=1 Tax=Desulfovibrio inopinatus TaxID=102109 RepID=UPI000487941A|nr:5'/3'-nucleotidase SurE [Desulfovibrio inopinatus]
MRILLTNDDGIQAIGLRSLYKALVEAGHDVACVAPVTEQSAVGHAVTIASPLRVKQFHEENFSGLGVSGTPADCVKIGLTTLLETPPDIVVSGINSGANVGVDILYSGTVSAATEGALMGYPALAVSYDDFAPVDLLPQGRYVASFLDTIDWSTLPQFRVLNLNFPKHSIDEVKGLKLCPQTDATYEDWFEEKKDPRGRSYYWLDGVIPAERVAPDSDRGLLTQGYITLTPLRFDFTDHETLSSLESHLNLS